MDRNRNAWCLAMLIALVLTLFSCTFQPEKVSEKASLTVKASYRGIQTASLIPSTPVPAQVKFELRSGDNLKKEAGPFDYDGSNGSYVIDDIYIGTYDVYAYGLDAEGRTIMMGGPKEFTVKPVDTNSVTIPLELMYAEYGSVALTLSWDTAGLSDTPIAAAIQSNRLGFLALYGDGENAGKTLDCIEVTDGNIYDLITWVDAPKGSAIYTVDNVPSTGKEAENVYFAIYTHDGSGKVTVLAKSFYTTLTVYDNLESIPDANETYNFQISSSTVEGYISNVPMESVEATATSETSITVTWDNPVFSADVYPITVTAWLTDKSGKIAGNKPDFTFADKEKASAGGKADFSYLSSDETYSFWTKVTGSAGYSKEEVRLDGITTKIRVESIAFPEGFSNTYSAGDKVLIEPVILPAEATNREFTLTEKSGAEGNVTIDEEGNVSFLHAGKYTLVLKSLDSEDLPAAEMEVTVRLGKPETVTAEAGDGSVIIEWTAVEDADRYIITRTAGDSSDEIDAGNVLTYEDTMVLSGVSYTYSVKAVMDEGEEFTGDATEAAAPVEIPEKGIQIILPSIPAADFSSVLEALDGKYINTADPDASSITIGFDANVTAGEHSAVKYEWFINDKPVLSGDAGSALKFTIRASDADSIGLHIGGDDSVNWLMVKVTLDDDTVLSSTRAFHVLKGNPGTLGNITDADGDNRVVYRSSDDNSEKLTLTMNGNTIDPLATWSIDEDDEAIAEIDETGVLTVKKAGTATVYATVGALGENATASAEIECYVPITGITLSEPENRRLIKDKTGVDVVNTDYVSADFTIAISGPDGLTPTLTADAVKLEYNTSYISIEGTGATRTIKAVGGGNTTVIAKADDAESNSFEMIAHDFDIYFTSEDNPVTGTSVHVEGKPVSGNTYNLWIKTSNASESTDKLTSIFNNIAWRMSDKEGQQLSESRTEFDSDWIKLYISGSGVTGSITREANDKKRNAGVILYDLNGQVAQVYFEARPYK